MEKERARNTAIRNLFIAFPILGIGAVLAWLLFNLVVQQKQDEKLQQEISICGPQGCKARIQELEEQLKAAKAANNTGKIAELQAKITALEAENKSLKDQLATQVGQEQGRKIKLVQVAEFMGFANGEFSMSEADLTSLEAAIQPFKSSPLLIVGIADSNQFAGPSAELKQLGLMIARAKLVEKLGAADLFYRVEQSQKNERGIRVYQMILGEQKTQQSGNAIVAPFPTSIHAQ